MDVQSTILLAGILLGMAWLTACFTQRLRHDLVLAQASERATLEQAAADIQDTYETVREREELFRLTFDQSPIGAAILNPEARFERVNQALCATLGYCESELLLCDLAAIIHPDDQAEISAQIGSLAAQGVDQLSREQRWLTREGATVWVRLSAGLVRDQHGAPLHVLLQAEDVTARKATEDALRERETMLRALGDNLPDAMIYQIVRDASGRARFTYVSAGVERISGMTPEQVYTKPELFTPMVELNNMEEYHAAVERSFRTLDVFEFELCKRLPNGEQRWSQLRSRPRRLPDGTTIWDGIEVDVTAHKQTEQQLRRRVDELQALNQIAHAGSVWSDLRSGLTGVGLVLRDLFAAQALDIWLYEGDDVVQLFSSSAEALGTFPAPPGRPGSALTSRLRDQQASVLLRRDDLALPADDPLAAEDTLPRPALMVPLQARGEPLGLLRVQAARPDQLYTPDDLALAQTIAGTLATAIENSRLIAQAQLSAAEGERRRLARELHDSVSQALFAANRAAEVLPQLWELDPEEGQAGLRELRRLTGGALAEMRTLLLELRPRALIEAPLHESLSQLAQVIATKNGVLVDPDLGRLPLLPPDVQLALYRIAQEALNNVSKHAQARYVTLQLVAAPPPKGAAWQGTITLRVYDDGQGFDLDCPPNGRLGLASMRERAAEIGAEFALWSRPGQGTQLTVRWTGTSSTSAQSYPS